MSKKNRKEKKHHGPSNENLKSIRAEKMKLGKIQLFILFAMIIAALIFVLPRINS